MNLVLLTNLKKVHLFNEITSIKVDLYGSLSLTGKGHATDLAILLGLSGADPEYIPTEEIPYLISKINLFSSIPVFLLFKKSNNPILYFINREV